MTTISRDYLEALAEHLIETRTTPDEARALNDGAGFTFDWVKGTEGPESWTRTSDYTCSPEDLERAIAASQFALHGDWTSENEMTSGFTHRLTRS